MLDSLVPLTSVLESHNKGNVLHQKEMIQAVKDAMELLGNANANLSHLRRDRVIINLNKSLLPIIGADSNFANAAPLLFGTEFAKKEKEMVEQVKAMRSTVSRKADRRPFFEGVPPSNRGDFTKRHSGRGGAESFQYRVRPYQGGKALSFNRSTISQT